MFRVKHTGGEGQEMEDPHMDRREAAQMNPLQLAYMGDSVWEMMVRSYLAAKRKNVHHMHLECVRLVNAASQAGIMKRLRPLLSEEEAQIAQRGRNAHARHPSPRHQDPGDYAEATGFEALLGFLYLTGDLSRLREIRDAVLENVETEDRTRVG